MGLTFPGKASRRREPIDKPNILFLCTGNSCRSQMAEGFARALKGDLYNVYSAGVEEHGLNPRAVQVMEEAGVSIRGAVSKTVEDLKSVSFDVVVSVCDDAATRCPAFPGVPRQVRRTFDDPAKAVGKEDEVMHFFRRVRDEIRDFVAGLPESLH